MAALSATSSAAAIAVSAALAAAPMQAPTNQTTQLFITSVLNEVASAAQTQKKFNAQKDAICALTEILQKEGHVSTATAVTGATKNKDATHRPVYVNAQAIFEDNFTRKMTSGEIKSVVTAIHTPTPCTPLCTKGEISDKLVHESMVKDTERTKTVTERADTIRRFLEIGGQLYVVYTDKKGRTPEQLAIYQAEVEKQRPLNNLHDCPLTKQPLPADMCGATYLITLKNNDQVLFSIKAKQANNPTEDDFDIWFAEKTHPKAVERLTAVNTTFVTCGGPTIFVEQPKK